MIVPNKLRGALYNGSIAVVKNQGFRVGIVFVQQLADRFIIRGDPQKFPRVVLVRMILLRLSLAYQKALTACDRMTVIIALTAENIMNQINIPASGTETVICRICTATDIVDARQWALLDTEYVRKHIVLLANSC